MAAPIVAMILGAIEQALIVLTFPAGALLAVIGMVVEARSYGGRRPAKGVMRGRR